MKSISGYENGIRKQMEELQNFSLPLLSWDIYSNHFSKLLDQNNDILNFNKAVGNLIMPFDFVKEYSEKKAVLVVTDINLNIEFVTKNMIQMSGYLPQEVIGKTPKMFQGVKTNKNTLAAIKNSINNKEIFEAKIINYKKDKSTYNCHIKSYPILNKKGEVVKYIAVEHAA